MVESHVIVNKRFTDYNDFIIWHDRLGGPCYNMIRKVIENSHGHTLKNQNVLQSKKFSYAACSQGKLVIKPSVANVGVESRTFWNGYRVIYADLFTLHVDHLNIIWS